MSNLRITAGFLPLLDSLLLVIAREKGFAASQGIDLALVRETSWANVRDRVAVGHFDVAQMLGPMPIAANLGLSPIDMPLVAPMTLGLGGNAVTVSTALWRRLLDAGAPGNLDPGPVGAALRKIVAEGPSRLRFAVTHPYSGHNYELRYWLAASGIAHTVLRPNAWMQVALEPVAAALRKGEDVPARFGDAARRGDWLGTVASDQGAHGKREVARHDTLHRRDALDGREIGMQPQPRLDERGASLRGQQILRALALVAVRIHQGKLAGVLDDHAPARSQLGFDFGGLHRGRG